MARDLFVASWDKGAPDPCVAQHGLSSSDFQTAFDDYASRGYRLRSLSGYESGGQDRYAAVWDKRDGGDWIARHDLSSSDYQEAFEEFTRLGYRPRVVSGYTVRGQDRYAAYWEKADGPPWAACHGLSDKSYKRAFDDYVARGYRPTWISLYAVGGQDRYAGIWEQSEGPAWVARHHQAEPDFREACRDLSAQGYDLICAGAAAVAGRDLYAGLWQKQAVGSVVHHGMTAPDYQRRFEQLAALGYQPRFIAAWAGEEPVDGVRSFAPRKAL
jgi:hypothetical protein